MIVNQCHQDIYSGCAAALLITGVLSATISRGDPKREYSTSARNMAAAGGAGIELTCLQDTGAETAPIQHGGRAVMRDNHWHASRSERDALQLLNARQDDTRAAVVVAARFRFTGTLSAELQRGGFVLGLFASRDRNREPPHYGTS